MELLNNNDFELFNKYAGKSAEEEPNAHQELKVVYEKLGYICQLLPTKDYKCHIIKNPRNMAQKFAPYHWAKVYPTELFDSCNEKICFVLGVDSDGLHIHIDGLKTNGYMNHPTVIPVRDSSYHYFDTEHKSYEQIVEEILSYMQSIENYNLLLTLGSNLGIESCTKLLIDRKKKMKEQEIQKLAELLLYKHQVILQGAPGTGKTYNAKLIAEELVKEQIALKKKPDSITNSDITNILVEGLKISSVSNYTEYKIEKIENNKVELSGNNIEPKTISFHKIISSYENKQWEPNKIINNLDSYEAALALYIYNNIGNVIGYKDKEKYINLVQFHPSYSYEDFVRGIVVNANNGAPEYINQNKLLGKFAKEAWENWNLYKLTQENKVNEVLAEKSKFEQFINSVQQKIDEDGKCQLTANVYLFEYDDARFKYKGNNWEAHASGLNMKYSELKKVFESGFKERSDIKTLTNIESLTNSHATYYAKMAEKYSSFQPTKNQDNAHVAELNNYVLIIDEINRANLPAVLGELIYALEYRGEKVESMYAIDGDNGLTLPPNLYIIGTMNTADRSVGQIDYAIRRRFAFVDMLPTVLEEENFDSDLFKEVSKLFIQNIEEYINDNTVALVPSDYLSSEFRPEDVWIGHSYFIMKDNRKLRLKYEIIPILKEYLKDGILKESAKGIIEKLR